MLKDESDRTHDAPFLGSRAPSDIGSAPMRSGRPYQHNADELRPGDLGSGRCGGGVARATCHDAASVPDLCWHPCQRPMSARRTLFPPSISSWPATKTVAASAKIRSDRVPLLAHVKADNVLPHDESAFLWMCGSIAIRSRCQRTPGAPQQIDSCHSCYSWTISSPLAPRMSNA